MSEILSKTLGRIKKSGSSNWRIGICHQTHKLSHPYRQSQRTKSTAQQDDKSKFKRIIRFFFGHEACPPDITQQNIKDDNIIQLLQFEPPKAKFIKEPKNQRCGRIIQQIFGQGENEKGPFDYNNPLETEMSVDVQANTSNREKIMNDILTSTSERTTPKNIEPAFDNSFITLQCSSNDKFKSDKNDKICMEIVVPDSPKNKMYRTENENKQKFILRIKNEKTEAKLKSETASIKEVPTAEQHVEEFNTVPKINNSSLNIKTRSGYTGPYGINKIDGALDAFASNCLKSPINKVNESVIKKMNKLHVPHSAYKSKKRGKDNNIIQSKIMRKKRKKQALEVEYENLKKLKSSFTGPEISPCALIFPITPDEFSSTEKIQKYKYEILPVPHEDTVTSVMTSFSELTESLEIEPVAENKLSDVKYTTPNFPLLHETSSIKNRIVENNHKVESPVETSTSNDSNKTKKQDLTTKNIVISVENNMKTDPSNKHDNSYYRTIEKDLDAYKIPKLVTPELNTPQNIVNTTFITETIVFPPINTMQEELSSETSKLYYETIEKDLEAYNLPKSKSQTLTSPSKPGNGTHKNIVFSIKNNKIEPSSYSNDFYCKTVEKDLESDRLYRNIHHQIGMTEGQDITNDKNMYFVEEARYQILTYLSPQLNTYDTQNATPVDLLCYSSHPNSNIYRGMNLQYDSGLKHNETHSHAHEEIYLNKNDIQNIMNASNQNDEYRKSTKEEQNLTTKVEEAITTAIIGREAVTSTDNNNLKNLISDNSKIYCTLTQKDVDTLPLSELLFRIRMRNRLENITECIEMCEAELVPNIESTCPPSIPRQLPPMPKCVPKDPTRFCPVKPSPCPKRPTKKKCKPPCGKPPKRKKCEFSNTSLKQINNNNVEKARQNEQPLSQSPLTSVECSASLYADLQYCMNLKNKKSMPENLTKSVKNFMETMRIKVMILRDDSVSSFTNNKSFEPWVPIPSWPTPKKEERKPIIPAKEGCPVTKPNTSNEPQREWPCTGFPKRTFSLPQFYF